MKNGDRVYGFMFRQYLGCEVIRDRTARTAELVQAGYAERVLRTSGMWECKPIHTPLDANSRLTKSDCPEVVYPILHRRYRSITGCLSYLVNMSRPDLAFAYFQLCKFVRGPISWKSSRQGTVTLSSSEAEFVAASQAGQVVVYLRDLRRGFGYP